MRRTGLAAAAILAVLSADAGARQARLAVGMAEADVEARKQGADEAGLDRRRAELSARMEQIGREMEKVGGEMESVGRRMDDAGARMEAAGQRIEERAQRAEAEARKLVDGWIRSGVARPLP